MRIIISILLMSSVFIAFSCKKTVAIEAEKAEILKIIQADDQELFIQAIIEDLVISKTRLNSKTCKSLLTHLIPLFFPFSSRCRGLGGVCQLPDEQRWSW